jgi:hypothetical protein
VPERELGIVSSESMLKKTRNDPLFRGWAGLTSPEGGTARARGRKRRGRGKSCLEPPAEIDGVRVNDQSYAV